ncbi:ArsR/SmtB family transcription factor [Halocalculus aciditolerans]|uniref:ArsR family transcriptional regulator n=1 Tax=Halocalculus aciditolerans TaxID=1383812 RepID=A0A830FNF5_9EURY|nr:helix-turn-helix domain-containing protein [Halocalculus aciditolerans]GGL70325.1 hypothetical protein GCM10009039_30460 [Halocalculus aciditolerans]
MSLLPSRDRDVEPSSDQDGALRVLDVGDEDADAVFDALSAETTRTILAEVHRETGTPSALAERADTSVQNAMYHLEKLRDADLVRVADTEYSSRGREMSVYAPPEEPMVVFVGAEERRSGLFATLKRLLGALGLLAVLAAVSRYVDAFTDPRHVLAAGTGAVTLLVTYASAARDPDERGWRGRLALNPMQRKALLSVAVVVAAACLTPAAIAYSPAVSGEYYTFTAPAGSTASSANAGVPDVADRTVTVVATGGDPVLRNATATAAAERLEARGATVRRADAVRETDGPLLLVRFADARVDASGLTPDVNATVAYAYVESGNATLARSGVDAAASGNDGPFMLRVNDSGRVTTGWFRLERGAGGLIEALNTIKRGGVDPGEYRAESGRAAGNATVEAAFDERLWT